MVAPIPNDNDQNSFMRHIFSSCCCFLPSTSANNDESPKLPRKESERIYFDLENIQILPTTPTFPRKNYYIQEQEQQEEEEEEQIIENVNIRISSEPEHFIFDQRGINRRAKQQQHQKLQRKMEMDDPAESYGISTSNWTETASSSETSSPVFAPSWRRNRIKFFHPQRRHYRAQHQHPKRIYAAAGAAAYATLRSAKKTTGRAGDYGLANSSSTNSLSSTPGPLKRFNCRRNLFQPTTDMSAGEEAKAAIKRKAGGNEPQKPAAHQMMDLHLKLAAHQPSTSSTAPPPAQERTIPTPHQQFPIPSIGTAIRPLHRTLSSRLSKPKLKLPPVNEESVLEEETNTAAAAATNLSPSNIPGKIPHTFRGRGK
jgi:hypothetical protein